MCIEYIKNVKFEVLSAVFLRNSWSTACYATVWVCVREDIGEGRGFIHQAGKQIHPYDAHHARKKTHAKCALLSGVLKPSVKSYTMFLIPVNAPAPACAAHLSHFSQLFFYSSFSFLFLRSFFVRTPHSDRRRLFSFARLRYPPQSLLFQCRLRAEMELCIKWKVFLWMSNAGISCSRGVTIPPVRYSTYASADARASFSPSLF